MSPSYTGLALSLLLLLSTCPLSQAGLQAFFYTDSACQYSLQYNVSNPTYLDWQHIPNDDIRFDNLLNITCVTPPPIDSPITYTVVSATYNCNLNPDTAGNVGLYVVEWNTPTTATCNDFGRTPTPEIAPDYVYSATFVYNRTGPAACTAGALYMNKSMSTPMSVYSQVYCVDNGNGVASAASVSHWAVALVIVLAALMVNS